MFRSIACSLVCFALVASVSADVIPVYCDVADQQMSATGGTWSGQSSIRVGVGSTTPSCGIFVFKLPTLEEGQSVSSADFSFTIIGGGNYTALYNHGIDVYALRMSSSSSASTDDFYNGTYGEDADATALEYQIVFEEEPLNQGSPGDMGVQSTSDEADLLLGSWLQSMYDSSEYDPNGDNYVFLRLSPDSGMSASYKYWLIASANNSVETDRPLLTITTVPEPATIGLLAVGAVALLRRRRLAV